MPPRPESVPIKGNHSLPTMKADKALKTEEGVGKTVARPSPPKELKQ
jgi:hypothetical protein